MTGVCATYLTIGAACDPTQFLQCAPNANCDQKTSTCIALGPCSNI